MKIVVTAGSRGTGPKMWLAMDPMRRWFETRKSATVFEDEEAAAQCLIEKEKDEMIPGGYITWVEDP